MFFSQSDSLKGQVLNIKLLFIFLCYAQQVMDKLLADFNEYLKFLIVYFMVR
jgi:hypothetical protein